MSQRGKRPNPNGVDSTSPIKRRKGRPPTVSVDADDFGNQSTNGGGAGSSVWHARPHSGINMSSIYNRSAPEAPAELFRKDLISAMKLPDSEPLSHEEYWVITDQWKQEWERGVQVPVNPDSLPEPLVTTISESYYRGRQDFKLPKNKYIRITKDENFSHDKHYLSNTPAMADSMCSYDLDQIDEAWLNQFNGERSMCGLPPVKDEQFERIIEELETRCHDKIQAIMKSEDGLGIEYDENVICDVCRSPDSEEANEMVFCDNCNICVHQACYGITTIPSGQWLCRTCSMGQKPDCVLCPNKGGAMKSTRSGQKWAHVSCALWIPEVSIGSVDRMEPITKISSIPQSRWALVCVLCRERVGACIQCSVKTCKTAYHVTCAFQHGLEMRAIIEDENAEDGVKLRSYCQVHSVKKEPKNSANANAEKSNASGSEDEVRSVKTCISASVVSNKKKVRKEMTAEERNIARMSRLREIQSEFDKHVSVKDISCHVVDVDQDGINHIYTYWILKRKSSGNHPLLMPKAGDVDLMSQNDQEQAEIEKMKMFVHLRQDLERVRNLCYMVSRREKFSRSYFRMREQIFHKQMAVLSSCKKSSKHDDASIRATMEANHGPSIYDVLYSSKLSDSRVMKIDEMIDAILGNTIKSPREINGSIKIEKKEKKDAISRYTQKFNGGTVNKKANNIFDSLSSDSDNFKGKPARRKSHSSAGRYSTHSASTSEDESNVRTKPSPSRPPPVSQTPETSQPKKRKGRPPGSTKKAAEEKRRLMNEIKKQTPTSSVKAASLVSSTDDEEVRFNKQPKSRLDCHHMSDESDELVPITNSSGHSIPTTGNVKRIQTSAIYSDSDSSSTDKDNKTDHTVSDSQQQPFRTKAAMKEFNINELLPLKQQKSNNKKASPSSPVKKVPQSKRETKTSPAKPRRMSTKPAPAHLTSDSDAEDVVKKEKVDVSSDFVVVPQREAAKKAQENLKTNSVQSSSSAAAAQIVDKSKKTDESISAKPLSTSASASEKKLEKTPTSKKPSKEEASTPSSLSSSIKKPQKEEKKEEKKEKAEKVEKAAIVAATDFPLDFPTYVPQRQAAKKAAEHIKGLGTSSVPSASVVAEKPSAPPLVPAAPIQNPSKKPSERRKSVAVDLSSSSTSSSSSGSTSGSSSDSESEADVDKKKTKTPPARRQSMSAAGLKQKAKESPFLDKSAKPSVTAKSSSSSSSSDSDSSSSDRVDTSRLPEKRNNSKRKSISGAAAATKVSAEKKSSTSRPSSPSKKPSAATKKETPKSAPAAVQAPSPARRQSTAVKQQQAIASSGTSKATTSSRSPQKLSTESANVDEPPAISSRKRSTSSACAPPSGKSSNNNRSRAADVPKGDPVKLPNENVVEQLLKSPKSAPAKEEPKRRKSTAVVEPVKEVEKVQETKATLRRSSRSDSFIKSPREPERLKSPEQSKKELDKLSVKNEKIEKAASEKTPKRSDTTAVSNKAPPIVDSSELKMDLDLTIVVKSPISSTASGKSRQSEPQLPSPMVSIPVMNLNSSTDDVFNDANIFNPAKGLFSLPKVADKEATERETYDLIKKLRQKNNNAPSVPDNNNIEKVVPESQVKKSPSLHRNEKEKPLKNEALEKSPQLLPHQQPSRFSPSVLAGHETKKSSPSPWQQLQSAENSVQHRSILTANNNKINAASVDPPPQIPSRSPADQHPKLTSLQQKLNEENSMITNRTNHFHPFGMMNDQIQPFSFNIQQQQQVQMANQQANQKDFNSKHPQSHLQQQLQQQPQSNFNKCNENVMNILNEMPKNSSLPPHSIQGPYHRFNENTMQNSLPGPVSLFPPSEAPSNASNQVQIPFPSPGQAMYPPSFANTTFTSSQQQMQNAETFGAQNFNQAQKIPNIEKVEVQKKSPSKSTRSSPRNSTPTHHSGGKTPQKSPAKSPRQSAQLEPQPISRQNSNQKGKTTPSTNEPKQRKSRTNSQASPAEHRSKARGGRKNNNNKSKFPQAPSPYIHSITHKKLVGTPFEFDDDDLNDTNVETLRGLRDRKSNDMFNKINRDGSSQSPKVLLGSLKHSLSVNNHAAIEPTTPAAIESNVVNVTGPVDMRTFNSLENTNDGGVKQIPGAIESNTVDPILNEIEEEQESELQSTLKASNDKQKTSITAEIVEAKSLNEVINIIEESVDSEASFTNKVSLSDSRNQLKVKIKGPLGQPDLHLNAITNPVIPQNVFTGIVNTPANPSSSRRPTMRKKELLQQYWNQGAADQEPQHQPSFDQQASMNVSRFAGFPKAVDSMEIEFDGFNYSEYKKRKRFAYNDGDSITGNNCDLNNSSNDGDAMEMNKKRRRANNRGGQQLFAGSNPPPKLKIKIGSDIMETSGSDLPPKKRHTQPQAPPSYQDLKRDYMNFRKQIMDDFSEEKSKGKEHRTKEEKREKKEKKKKKKEKKNRDLGNAPLPMKLILKIGNKSVTTISKPSVENTNSNSNSTISTVSSDTTKSQTSPAPLKLKFSRNSHGNGEYNVMNTQNVDKQPLTVDTPKPSPSLSNNNLLPPVINDSAIKDLKAAKKNEISADQLSILRPSNENSVTTTPLPPPPVVQQAS